MFSQKIAVSRIQAALIRAQHLGRKTMLAGRRIDNNTVTLAGAPTGKAWVRSYDDSREETAVWGTVSTANTPIEIAPRPSGDYEIVGLDPARAAKALGNAAAAALIPRGIDDTTPRSIAGLGFVPGRVEWAGGMNLHVASFDHSGGRWIGEQYEVDQTYTSINLFDLTPYVPTATTVAGWVKLYCDPVTNTLSARAGATMAGDVDVLVQSADPPLPEDILLPPDVIPLGAVGVYTGMTVIDPRLIRDVRIHISAPPFNPDRIMVDANYNIMIDANGNVMYGAG